MTLDEREAVVSAHNRAVGMATLVGWLADAVSDTAVECAGRAIEGLASELVGQLKAIAQGAAE